MVDRPPGQKSSNNTLYFIVGALVIAVLIIGWVMYGGGEEAGTTTTTTTEQPATPPAEPAPATPPAEPAPATPPAAPATPPPSPRQPRLQRPSPHLRHSAAGRARDTSGGRAGTGNASGHDASVVPGEDLFLGLGAPRKRRPFSLPAMLRRLWNGGARELLPRRTGKLSDGRYPAPSRRSNRAASGVEGDGMDPYPTYRDGGHAASGDRAEADRRRASPLAADLRVPILIGLAVFALIIVIRIVWGGINMAASTDGALTPGEPVSPPAATAPTTQETPPPTATP